MWGVTGCWKCRFLHGFTWSNYVKANSKWNRKKSILTYNWSSKSACYSINCLRESKISKVKKRAINFNKKTTWKIPVANSWILMIRNDNFYSESVRRIISKKSFHSEFTIIFILVNHMAMKNSMNNFFLN